MGFKSDKFSVLSEFFEKISSKKYWKTYFKRPTEDLTLLLLSRGSAEVRKIRLTAKALWGIKIGFAIVSVIFVFSFIFFLTYLVEFPQRSLLTEENHALKKELSKIQSNLDTLELSVDRITRFDQKLRAITDVKKEFAKMKGPPGQGGEEAAQPDETIYDFSDYKVDSSSLTLDEESRRKEILELESSLRSMNIFIGSHA